MPFLGGHFVCCFKLITPDSYSTGSVMGLLFGTKSGTVTNGSFCSDSPIDEGAGGGTCKPSEQFAS